MNINWTLMNKVDGDKPLKPLKQFKRFKLLKRLKLFGLCKRL